MPLSPTAARLRGRLGGLSKALRHPGPESTAAARQAFETRWEREVDPEGVLPVAERMRRAERAKSLYYAQLAYKKAAKASARRAASAAPATRGKVR